MEKMTYIGQSSREQFEELFEIFDGVENFMGYLPNAYLSMAENPDLLKAFSNLAATIFSSQQIDIGTKQLIALASSLSSGCKYCQAHTSHGAERAGISDKKIADILKFQDSDNYSESEKALLELAFAAGKTPNEASQAHFDHLEKYFSKSQIIDIVSVISLFGYLNRWNDTLGTQLERVPEDYVTDKLKPLGWR